MRHAHAMSSIGLIFGFSGIKAAARKDYPEVMKTWVPYLELARLPRGGAAFLEENEILEEINILASHPLVMPWWV